MIPELPNCGTAELEDHNSKSGELKARTKKFAIRMVRMFRSLPNKPAAQIIGKQALRAGTAVTANYRATCRARSKAEFTAKIGIVSEEADESVFWLEMLIDCELIKASRAEGLLKEAKELSAIFTASYNTARGR